MLSRSVQRRLARRRPAAEPQGPASIRVHLRLQDAKGISQSFLILPGTGTSVILSGYTDRFGGMGHINVPVIVEANIV
jgi:hypothetical protein